MGPPTTSRQLIEQAIELYATAAERLRWSVSDDPDIGFGPGFVSGLRSLKARLEAQPFSLEHRILERYRSIVDEESAGGGFDEEAAWLESFPRRVLGLLDRRNVHVATLAYGRRWMDRVTAGRPRPHGHASAVSSVVPAG